MIEPYLFMTEKPFFVTIMWIFSWDERKTESLTRIIKYQGVSS